MIAMILYSSGNGKEARAHGEVENNRNNWSHDRSINRLIGNRPVEIGTDWKPYRKKGYTLTSFGQKSVSGDVCFACGALAELQSLCVLLFSANKWYCCTAVSSTYNSIIVGGKSKLLRLLYLGHTVVYSSLGV